MTDRAIIFSPPMVHALLDGRKTQTRRVLKPQPHQEGPFWRWHGGGWSSGNPMLVPGHSMYENLPARPGDRLWVREAWSHNGIGVWTISTARMCGRGGVIYRADRDCVGVRWWSSIHMPREFSRLTLTVTDVRVERLQDISREDAIAEGIQRVGGGMLRWENWTGAESQSGTSPQAAYALLWNSLHGPDAWTANPWVAAITFTVDQRNIGPMQRGETT